MSTLVAACGLTRVYKIKNNPLARPQELRAVGGISFEIEAGHTLAIVGESGCGKSTLARLVTMIERPDAGSLTIDNADALNPGERSRLRPVVQLMFQNPYGSLNPRRKVGKILEEPLLINTSLGRTERRRDVITMMRRVGLSEEQAQRYPHMFSGGQRQRVAIARALMLRPKLVVADEPVSALDVSVQAQVLNLLVDLQEQFGLAYMFISHDLAVVRFIAHDVLVMYLGLAIEHGPKNRIFEQPLHPYTQALLASTPGLRPFGADKRRQAKTLVKGEVPSATNMPKGCVFEPRCPHATELCRSERPVLRSVGGRQVACHYAERIGLADAV